MTQYQAQFSMAAIKSNQQWTLCSDSSTCQKKLKFKYSQAQQTLPALPSRNQQL